MKSTMPIRDVFMVDEAGRAFYSGQASNKKLARMLVKGAKGKVQSFARKSVTGGKGDDLVWVVNV